MQVYFHRSKLTKKFTSTFKKMIFLSNCAQCMGHYRTRKKRIKISKITKYYSVVCACILQKIKKATKKFTAAADNEKVRRKGKCKSVSMH